MHTCDECGAACYCDMDDTDLGLAPLNCTHACDEDDDFDLYDEDDGPAPRQEDGE